MGFLSSKKIKTEDDEEEVEGRHLNEKEGVELKMAEEKEEEAKERVCSDFIKYTSRWYILAIYALFGNMQVSALAKV